MGEGELSPPITSGMGEKKNGEGVKENETKYSAHSYSQACKNKLHYSIPITTLCCFFKRC